LTNTLMLPPPKFIVGLDINVAAAFDLTPKVTVQIDGSFPMRSRDPWLNRVVTRRSGLANSCLAVVSPRRLVLHGNFIPQTIGFHEFTKTKSFKRDEL
jgi:hypothetical protein